MAKPQQPELRRSGEVAALNPDAAEGEIEARKAPRPSGRKTSASRGKVPAANQPGHQPDEVQDKPDPQAFIEAAATPLRQEFDFHVDRAFLGTAFLLELSGGMKVVVDEETLSVRFGPWAVETPLSNVSGAAQTGPFRLWKVAGGTRMSLADRGLTLATSTARGVCVTFEEPVTGGEPFGRIRHPGLTVTVKEPEELIEALSR